MTNPGGWAGKILRVNLSTGEITKEDTLDYKDYIGGMGIGYKVIWDEVPKGTKAYDEENKIIFGAGPLTGTGMPCSGRTNITSLSPLNPYNAITDSHMGGHFSPEMKFAGYDAIIIEGKADKPVWLRIENDDVFIEEADSIWGNGTYRATQEINNAMGEAAQVAAIGQAGENMVNMSTIMTGFSHSAGGHGGVMGSKNLKAIGIRGTKPVNIAGDQNEWRELQQKMNKVIGSNNQHVVPNSPLPWAEHYDPGSRWTGKPGLYWGAADPPVETGECHPDDVNSLGYRCQKAVFDAGDIAEKYTVRMGGCHACPVRCHARVEFPQLEEHGYSRYSGNTCVGWATPARMMIKGTSDEGDFMARTLGKHLVDDYGIWDNYCLIVADFEYAYENGILEEVLPEEEYEEIPWDLLEDGDPAFLKDFYRRIAFKEGKFGETMGKGSYWVATEWEFGDDYWHGDDYGLFSVWNYKFGYPQHHSNETYGQVGALINCMFNRDAQLHTHVNLQGSGLPHEIQEEIVEEIVGSKDAIDPPADYTPVNEYKAKYAKWSIIRNLLHDSLTLCNWMWPMHASPRKEWDYRGDTALEAKFLSVATGEEYTEEELDRLGERMFTLHRALTVKQMDTADMRNEHDVISDWVFDMDPDMEPFEEGTIKMDRDDMQKALTLFYKEMGWDEETGAPTRECLEELDLGYVADELEEQGLLPS
ncbi:aldehyde ferredoxin oxidoreductase [Natranaerobius thermophilus]|uniref:Aldehyde ferredoxin oxidoreductase n=1 Tax=Natranaerobius thermophilus (strain ATCC BAA-1301 / DSM 18059 / JW/NM-WN-LF) TaxID=457570 RepID=B2A8G1_NATTJ|nr:aldehyde ferredoxin oxidoreductase [Natranaerobius thermophilus]ACB85845.1 Aldehyde ferredoxin oxidoreductase [Natranaerobius thermophilus JW/NM-WN-LF]